MSASTPGGSNPALPAAGGADPSMEDILASIRRILSEDEAPAVAPVAEAHPPEAPVAETPVIDTDLPDADDVLSLDSSMLVEEPPAAPAILALPPPVEPPPAVKAAPAMAAPSMAASDELLGPAAAAAASSSVGTLIRTLAERQSLAVYRGGPTLEDIVRDEMRPLLRAWLDENLPPLVERLVRAEIERVVGRAVA
jgi:cell pole-organizing protein PopZ